MSAKNSIQLKKNEAYLISDKTNIKYLSNFSGSAGLLLLTGSLSYLITDFRYQNVAKLDLPSKTELIITSKPLEEIRNLLKSIKINTLYFEEDSVSVKKYQNYKKKLKKIRFLPSKSRVKKQRIQKSAREIKLIIKAQRIGEKTFKEVTKKIKVGHTEKQIAWEIEKAGRENGADNISFPPIVAFGKNSASPHHQNSNKKLKKGDLILIDMGLIYKGYCSDMTRILFTAPPTPKQKEIYDLVLRAQKETIKKLKPGMTGQKADKIARDIIAKAGYAKEFGHSLGHGIGLEVHEEPYLSTKYTKPIPNNSVVTVEPGVYLQNSFGIRIEDMVLVKHNKVESITGIPTKIKNLMLSVC